MKNRQGERVKSIQTYTQMPTLTPENKATHKEKYAPKQTHKKQKPARHIQGPEVHAHFNLQLQTGRHSQIKTLTQRGIDIEGLMLTYKGRLKEADRHRETKIYICASNIQHADSTHINTCTEKIHRKLFTETNYSERH